jgi:uncharacterized protein (DUF486 family)
MRRRRRKSRYWVLAAPAALLGTSTYAIVQGKSIDEVIPGWLVLVLSGLTLGVALSET